jgi:hypothetical protein
VSDLSRWPNLKLATHPVLDWVETTYDQATLLKMAEAISKNPHPIQTRTATGAAGVWDTAIESLLRALADAPAALEKLNRTRPTPPRRVVGLNRAVHYFVQLEILGPDGLGYERKDDALKNVSDAWGKSVATIKEDRTTHTAKTNPSQYWCDDTGDIQRPEDAKRVTEQILVAAMVAYGMTRTEALKGFDSDMRHRAKSLQE